MSKHTPAKWQSHDDDYCPEDIYGNLELDDGVVGGTHICTVHGEHTEEFRANVALIIAAPEGRDLLMKIHEFFRHNGPVDPSMMFDETRTFKRAVEEYVKKAHH